MSQNANCEPNPWGNPGNGLVVDPAQNPYVPVKSQTAGMSTLPDTNPRQ